MLLCISKRGGKTRSFKSIKDCYTKFLEYKRKDLLQPRARVSSPKDHSSPSQGVRATQARKAALRLIRCGELAQASRVLTCSGLACTSPDTINKLKAKHPSQVNNLDVAFSAQVSSIYLSKSSCQHCSKSTKMIKCRIIWVEL